MKKKTRWSHPLVIIGTSIKVEKIKPTNKIKEDKQVGRHLIVAARLVAAPGACWVRHYVKNKKIIKAGENVVVGFLRVNLTTAEENTKKLKRDRSETPLLHVGEPWDLQHAIPQKHSKQSIV